jgi:phosphopantothenoylcysteine decarboxylase
MNTLMWEHPATARHLRQIAEDLGASAPASTALPYLVEWINRRAMPLRVVAPVSKRLACDDVGVGAMAPRDAILDAVRALHQEQGD